MGFPSDFYLTDLPEQSRVCGHRFAGDSFARGRDHWFSVCWEQIVVYVVIGGQYCDGQLSIQQELGTMYHTSPFYSTTIRCNRLSTARCAKNTLGFHSEQIVKVLHLLWSQIHEHIPLIGTMKRSFTLYQLLYHLFLFLK